MRDEPNAKLRCRNIRSSDTTKGVSSSRQQVRTWSFLLSNVGLLPFGLWVRRNQQFSVGSWGRSASSLTAVLWYDSRDCCRLIRLLANSPAFMRDRPSCPILLYLYAAGACISFRLDGTRRDLGVIALRTCCLYGLALIILLLLCLLCLRVSGHGGL